MFANELTISHTRDRFSIGAERIIQRFHTIHDGARRVGEIIYYNYGVQCYMAVYYHGPGHFTKVHTSNWQIAKHYALTGETPSTRCPECGIDLTNPANSAGGWHICKGAPLDETDHPF